jgi:hypothetical protein
MPWFETQMLPSFGGTTENDWDKQLLLLLGLGWLLISSSECLAREKAQWLLLSNWQVDEAQ